MKKWSVVMKTMEKLQLASVTRKYMCLNKRKDSGEAKGESKERAKMRDETSIEVDRAARPKRY